MLNVTDQLQTGVSDPTFIPQSLSQAFTLTINVRPVNDPPIQIVTDISGTNLAAPTDDAFIIDPNGALTFTLKEDNAGSTGPYVIEATNPNFSPLGGAGYERPGLLDLYSPGPANEVGDFLGGSQVLAIDKRDFLDVNGNPVAIDTLLGGQVTANFLNDDIANEIVSLNYTPPADINQPIGGTDSFTYTIVDDVPVAQPLNPNAAESWSLLQEAMIDDRRTVRGRLQLNLRPVNDAPVADIGNLSLEVAEDSGVQTVSGFATNIAAGPAGATDETDLFNGQDIEFMVDLVSVNGVSDTDVASYFDTAPRITDVGTLIYETSADVFGEFLFDVVLTDDGASDVVRGDINARMVETLTINVRPLNDPPRLVDPTNPITFTTPEDTQLLISANGSAVPGDLLASYLPGAVNETAAGIVGGDQTITFVPPTTTQQGVILTDDNMDGVFEYVPPSNFVGTDLLVYTISDNGQSVAVGTDGTAVDDFQSIQVTVPITVEARNDAPVITSTEIDISVLEGDGAVEVINWLIGVAPGPSDATDEISGATQQSLALTLNEIITVGGQDQNIDFVSDPAVELRRDAATIRFEAEENSFGTAVYDLVLMDDGIDDPTNGEFATTIRRFTITVEAVNDPPTFTAGGPVAVDEDSGPYSQQWATNIDVGPREITQTIDRFEIVVPTDSQSLFSDQPAISTTGVLGVLTFTPAQDAAGQVDLQVTAVDSEEGRSVTEVLSITINDLNDPPVGVDDLIDTDEDTILQLDAADLLANDIDPDLLTNPNEALAVFLSAQFQSAQGANVTFDAATGQITYDPTTSTVLDALTEK